MPRCPVCGLYTKPDARIARPYEECRRCGVVKPIGEDEEPTMEEFG